MLSHHSFRLSTVAVAAASSAYLTSLNIATTGRPHLGAPLGTQTFVTQYVMDKVDNWVKNVIALSHIATTQHILHLFMA